MKKSLHLLKSKLLYFLAAFVLITATSKAEVNEDSCKALMLITPDHFDPLLMHFSFIGMVPINSFQFLGSWDFGDGYTSTDSCPDHLYAAPGTYIVCLSFSICIGGGLSCHDDTCESITIGTLAGVNSADGNLHQFYFYPNPVRDKVSLRSDASTDLEVRIRDVAGHMVYSGNTGNDQSIDVSNLSNGLYMMEVTDGNAILQRKMILQR